MAEAAVTETVQPPEQPDEVENRERRGKSNIQFPYYSLEDAVTLARGVHGFGNSCHTDQLAAHLNQTPKSGAFRLKLLSAKLFGLLTYTMGNISLTQLGSRICDPQHEQSARVEAFLHVPLYRKLHDQYRGVNLPPPSGLETAMVNLGVIENQKAAARQVLQRSAQYAGFFWSGVGRLVRPHVRVLDGAMGTPSPAEQNGGGGSDETLVDTPKGAGGNGGGNGGGGECDPAIHGLIKRLPTPDSNWPLEKQAKWLLAISHAFDVIYPRDDDGRTLRIEIVKD